jgi:uroporphyrinogen decarboxylase
MAWSNRDRVLAAIDHEEPDRVPIDLGGSYASSIVIEAYDKLKAHLGLEHETKVMSTLHRLALPDESVLQHFDVDTRAIMPGGYQGGHVEWLDDYSYVDEFGVTLKSSRGTDDRHFLAKDGPFFGGKLTKDRIDAFEWPDPDNPGIVKGVAEQVARYKAAGDYCLVLNVPGQIIHRGYSMRGIEDFLKDLYRAPEAVCYMMDRLTDFCVRATENMVEAAGAENVDIIFFGEDLGTQDGCMFDPEGIYARYIKPRHERVIQSAKALTGAKSLFHCCGSAYHFIDHLIDIGVDALNPVQVTAKNMEPERLKGEFGKRMAFWGGFNTQEILPYASADAVRDEARRCISIFGEHGGYVLTSVHNVQTEVPAENVSAMLEAGRDHRYH